MVPAIATHTPGTLRISSIRMRGHGGRWGMAHLVFAGATFVKGFATIAKAERFIKSQAVA